MKHSTRSGLRLKAQHLVVTFFIGSLMLTSSLATAATRHTWNGFSAFTANWSDFGNWDFFILPPLNGFNDAIIYFNGGAIRGPNLDDDYTVNTVVFDADPILGEQAFTLQSVGNRTLTIGGNVDTGIVNRTSLTQRIDHGINIATAQLWHAHSGNLEINGPRTGIGSNLTLFTAPGKEIVFRGSGESYFGSVDVVGGKLRLAQSGTLSDLGQVSVAAQGVLFLDGAVNETVGRLIGDGVVALNNARLSIGANNVNSSFSGLISGDILSEFTKLGSGTAIFGGAQNSTVGLLRLSGGTLAITDSAIYDARAVDVQGGAQLIVNQNAALHVTGTLNNSGHLVLDNNAALSASVIGTSAGAEILLNGGDLRAHTFNLAPGGVFDYLDGVLRVGEFNGDLRQDGGITAAGNSPGTMVVNGDYWFHGGELEFEIAGLIPSAEYDVYQINGDLNLLGGQLRLGFLNGFLLGYDQQFDIVNVAGTLTGMFAGLVEGGLVGNFEGLDLYITYLAGDGNDVALFTGTAPDIPGPVPLPASVWLALAGFAALAKWRRKPTDGQTI